MRFGALVVLAGVLALALAGSVSAQMTFGEIIMARDVDMIAEDVDTAVALYADGAMVSTTSSSSRSSSSRMARSSRT